MLLWNLLHILNNWVKTIPLEGEFIHLYCTSSWTIHCNYVGKQLVLIFSCSSGVQHVFDTTFSREFSLIETSREFMRRHQNKASDKTSLPMLTSACPGKEIQIWDQSDWRISKNMSSKERLSLSWIYLIEYFILGWVCYAEKTHGSYILPYISTTKSPQQIMGSLVKDYFARVHNK